MRRLGLALLPRQAQPSPPPRDPTQLKIGCLKDNQKSFFNAWFVTDLDLMCHKLFLFKTRKLSMIHNEETTVFAYHEPSESLASFEFKHARSSKS